MRVSRVSSSSLRSFSSDLILSSSRLNSSRYFSTSIFSSASSFSSEDSSDSSSSGQSPAFNRSLSNRFPQEQIVWLGNLPDSTTRDSVISALSSIGGIAEVDIISDRYSGQPRGFGFVAFDSAEKAKTAIEKGGFDINGTQITVKTSKTRDDSSLGGRKVFVGNVPFQITKEQLDQELSKFGALDDIHIPTNVDGRPRGYCFVVFKNKEDAQKALSQREVEINNRILRCEPFVNIRRGQGRFGEGGFGTGGQETGFSGSARQGGYGQRQSGGGYGSGGQGGYGGGRQGGYGSGGSGGSGGYGGGRQGGYGENSYGGGRQRGYGNRRSSDSDHADQSKESSY